MNKLLLVAMVSVFAGFAQAEENIGKDHPCHEVKTACEAAGFVNKSHKKDGKGLHIDCIKKLIAGETVPGVTVAADKIEACKAKKAEKAAK